MTAKKNSAVAEEIVVPIVPSLRHQLRYVPVPGEVNNNPSMTVPDMSLSVQEILQRYAQGRPLSVSSNLHFTGDDYTPDVRKMDLTELEDMRRQNAERINELQQKLVEAKKSKESKKIRSEIKKELEQELRNDRVKQLDIEDAILEIKEKDNKKS